MSRNSSNTNAGILCHNFFMKLNLYSSVKAGFPSPADDFLERKLDLNNYLVPHPAATFLIRVSGDSMVGAGIFDNDILVVDRSLDAISGDVVVAVIENDFTVKRLVRKNGFYCLVPENPKYNEVKLNKLSEIWGVVTFVLHKP